MFRTKCVVFCLFLTLTGGSAVGSEGLYYLFKGKRIPIQLDESRVALEFDQAATEHQRDSLLNSFPELGRLVDSTAVSGFLIYEVKPTPVFGDLINSLRTSELLSQVEPGYQTVAEQSI